MVVPLDIAVIIHLWGGKLSEMRGELMQSCVFEILPLKFIPNSDTTVGKL